MDKEKDGGPPRDTRLMNNFRDVVDLCSLRDIGFSRDRFTWRKSSSNPNGTRGRLDRYMVNRSFDYEFTNLKVMHLNFHNSDHRPILAIIENQSKRQARKKVNLMRFEESWTAFPEVKEIIRKSWNNVLGRDVEAFSRSILRCLEGLINRNKERLNGSIGKAIDRKLQEIKGFEEKDLGAVSQKLLQAEKDLKKLLEEEEMYWKIRSREE